MQSINKITDYISVLEQKTELAIAAPYSLLVFAIIIAIFSCSWWLKRIAYRKLSPKLFPQCVLRNVLHSLLCLVSLLILNITLLVITQKINILVNFLIWLELAAVIINAIKALTIYGLNKRTYAKTLIKTITLMLWVTAIVSITDQNNDIINLLEGLNFHLSKSLSVSAWDILHGLASIICIFIFAKLLVQLAERKINQLAHVDNSIQQILLRVCKISIFIISFMIALPLLGIDVTALSVFGGAIGVGIGFGLQKITSNFLSGFIILLDRSIKVGDRLVVDNTAGIVAKITTRYVVLERFDGTELLIPNETFVTNNIQNQSYSSNRLRSEVIFSVSDNNDISQALQLIKQALQNAPNTIAEKAYVSISRLVDNGVEIKGYFWVEQPALITETNNLIYISVFNIFKQHGIKTPQTTRKIELISDDKHS